MLSIKDRILIGDLPALIGKNKRTIERWIQLGVVVRGVGAVKLRTERIGWQRYSCQAWVDEFIAKLNQEPATAAVGEMHA
jgi:hypothetical protein